MHGPLKVKINMHLRQMGPVLPCTSGFVAGSADGFSKYVDKI